MSLLYDEQYPVELDLHFGSISDTSDYTNWYDKGIQYKLTTNVRVDGWVFELATPLKTIHTIIITYYDKDDLTEDQYTEIMVEDSNQDVELEATLRLFTQTYDLT